MQPARLRVRVHPGARRNELEGWRNGVLHAGVTGPEPGSAANAELIGLVAERLNVTPGQVTILFGEEERLKELAVDGLDQASAEARLDAPVRLTHARRGRAAAAAALAALAVVVLIVVLVSGSAGAGGHGATTAGSDGGVPVSVTTTHGNRKAAATTDRSAGRHRTRPRRHLRPRPDPGKLPQTDARPSAATPEFAVRMRGLWQAIAGGPVTAARAAYFPETAYVQLKSIGDPAGDWLDRLYADYRLDIAAAHRLLGARAASARLLRTDVVTAYAHWVPPAVCDNRVGYWELPNARLVYNSGGQVRSIGIASMISWRGVWYVVHLGLVAKNSVGGVVDAPSAGPGVSSPSSTC